MNTTQKIPLNLDQKWASYEFWKIGNQSEEINWINIEKMAFW
jgi:hypothetical protein